MALVEHVVDVSFGDCDPAGLVFYPNYARWMDATFHRLLAERAGGHARLCERLGLKGVGLIEANLGFRSPVTEGQQIIYRVLAIEWSKRSLLVHYEAETNGRVVLEAREKRGVFAMSEGKMIALDVEGFRQLLGL